MLLIEDLHDSLSIGADIKTIPEEIYQKLIEFVFLELTELNSTNISTLLPSKIDLLKSLHAGLITATLRFVQNNVQPDSVSQLLVNDLKYSKARADYYSSHYERNKLKLEIKLGDVGTHLPHVVDVKWDIDYVLQKDVLNVSEGPIFRVNLIAEKFNAQKGAKELESIRFSCTSQEMQDLVYKLKDALRHCQKIAGC